MEDAHARIRSQLAAYLNGRLSELERARVRAHLDGCAECTAALSHSRDLVRALDVQDPDGWTPSEERFEEIISRIAPDQDEREEWSTAERMPSGGLSRPVRLLVSASIALVLMMALSQFTGGSRDGNRSATPADARMQIAFEEHVPEARMRALLRSVDASIVGGPDSSGRYLLAIPSGASADQVLSRLQASSDVRDANLLDGLR